MKSITEQDVIDWLDSHRKRLGLDDLWLDTRTGKGELSSYCYFVAWKGKEQLGCVCSLSKVERWANEINTVDFKRKALEEAKATVERLTAELAESETEGGAK